jgi:hypothetical protein
MAMSRCPDLFVNHMTDEMERGEQTPAFGVDIDPTKLVNMSLVLYISYACLCLNIKFYVPSC